MRIEEQIEENSTPGLHPDTIARHRRAKGIYIYPQPKAEPFRISQNDRALMLAMVLSGYQTEVIHWGSVRHPFIKVSTGSVNPKYPNLLRMEFTGLGESNNNQLEPGYYLDYDSAKFLTHPEDELKISLSNRFGYTAFLWGWILLRLTPKGHRLSLRPPSYVRDKLNQAALFEFAHDQYQILGLRLGEDGKPLPLGYTDIRSDTGNGYVVVDEPQSVIWGLLKESGVNRLRLFRRPKELPGPFDTGKSDDDEELRALMRNFLVDAQEIKTGRAQVGRLAREFLLV